MAGVVEMLPKVSTLHPLDGVAHQIENKKLEIGNYQELVWSTKR